jgi:hypothetical protein
MKNLFIILFVLLSVQSYGQIISDRGSNGITVRDWRWMGGYNAFLPRYADTTAANLQKGIDSCGAEIYCYGTGLWYRECSPKRWVQLSSVVYAAGYGLALSSATFRVDTTTLKNVYGALYSRNTWVGNNRFYGLTSMGDSINVLPGISKLVVASDTVNATVIGKYGGYFRSTTAFTTTPPDFSLNAALWGVSTVGATNTQNFPEASNSHPAFRGVTAIIGANAGAVGYLPYAAAFYGTISGTSGFTIGRSSLIDITYGHDGTFHRATGISIRDVDAGIYANTGIFFTSNDNDSIADGNWFLYQNTNRSDYKNNLYRITTDSLTATAYVSTPSISLNGVTSTGNAAANGTTKGFATFTASDFDASSGVISIDYTNGQSASGSTKGFLTAADWTTFNNKLSSLSLAAIGSSPNANGATYSAGTLNLEPASASFGGIVTTGTQTFAGVKTLASGMTVQGTSDTYLNIASSGANTLDRGILFKDASNNIRGLIDLVPNASASAAMMSFFIGSASGTNNTLTGDGSGRWNIGANAGGVATSAYGKFMAGTSSIAPQQFIAGTNLTIPVSGSEEFDGTERYSTNSTAVRGSYIVVRQNVSSAGTLTLATTYTNYIFSGTSSTWTLPPVSGTTNHVFYIKNRGSGIITLNTAASANELYTTSPVNTLAINPGESYMLISDGTYFNIQ